jgi:predicted metal-dependent TIM-barrel fold hydrolase
MRIIDPHAHMFSRTTDDYENMAVAGIECIVEPAFWLGSNRRYAGSFFDYFNHITTFEPQRAAKRGIKHFCVIGCNPKETEDIVLFREVLAGMPEYLDRENAIGIGEIGLNDLTPNEEKALSEQLELAKERRCPVLIHTPHNNKLEGTLRILDILRETGNDPELVDVDHCTEETIRHVRERGYWSGITMYPRTKCTPQRARDMLERFGIDHMLINSSCDWEWSDPLAVPKCAHLMLMTGFSREQTERVVFENPKRFLSGSPKFRLVEPRSTIAAG